MTKEQTQTNEDYSWFQVSSQIDADVAEMSDDVTIVSDIDLPPDALPLAPPPIPQAVAKPTAVMIPRPLDPLQVERQHTIKDMLAVLLEDYSIPKEMVDGIEWSLRQRVADRVRLERERIGP